MIGGASKIPSMRDGFRPLWRVGVAVLIAQATAALVPTMVVREALIAHFHEGLKPWEGPLVRPATLTLDWFAQLSIAYGWAFLCVLPGALLFVAAIARLERIEARSIMAWGIVGVFSAIPLAIGFCILVGMHTHAVRPPPSLVAVSLYYLLVAAVPCAIGFCGGIVGRRFRPGVDWSDPL